MASIPSNGYAEVMSGTNNYSGSNSFDGSCPRTAIPPVIGDDLCNKTYVDNATGGGIIGSLTDKGSLITGDGTQAVIFDQNPYQTALTTTTVYDWNALAIGQSRTFTTTVATIIPLGAGITITYSGTDSIKGNVTAVVGSVITITITNLASLSYSSTFLLQTSGPQGTGGDYTNATFPFNAGVTTPNPPNIPANTIITDGEGYISTSFTTGIPVSITANIIGSNIQRPSATPFTTIPFDNPTFTPTFYNFPSGCFVGTTQSPSVQFLGGTYRVGFPLGGTFAPPNYVGSLSGYTVAYSTGSIVIDDDICLIADATSATGLAWGVINTASIGAVTSVSGGTNIVMSGTIPAPIVNLRNPLTAELNMGSQSLRDSASAVGTSGQILSAGTGGQTLWTNAPATNPTITDTNTNATYYPTFVAGSGTQPLLADISTGPISLNPSNGDFNVVDTLKLTQTQVAVGKGAGQTSQGSSCVAIGYQAGQTSQPNNSIILNASGVALNPATTSAFYVNPIRSLTGNQKQQLQYNPTTFEVSSFPNSNNVVMEDFDMFDTTANFYGNRLSFFESGNGSVSYYQGVYEATILTGAQYRRGVIQMASGVNTGSTSSTILLTDLLFSYANISKVTFGIVPHTNENLSITPVPAGNTTYSLGISDVASSLGNQTTDTVIWRMTSSNATVPAWTFVINNVVQYTLTITPTNMTAKWCRAEINVNYGGGATATVSGTWYNLTDGTSETTGTYTITAGTGFPAALTTPNTVGIYMACFTNNNTQKYMGVDYVEVQQPNLYPVGSGTTETTGR
jgi:hypothetical protein